MPRGLVEAVARRGAPEGRFSSRLVCRGWAEAGGRQSNPAHGAGWRQRWAGRQRPRWAGRRRGAPRWRPAGSRRRGRPAGGGGRGGQGPVLGRRGLARGRRAGAEGGGAGAGEEAGATTGVRGGAVRVPRRNWRRGANHSRPGPGDEGSTARHQRNVPVRSPRHKHGGRVGLFRRGAG